MSNQHQVSHVFMQSDRIVLDAQALALATILIAAACGVASCGGEVVGPQPPANSTGGVAVIGPGVCAVYASGGTAGGVATTLASSSGGSPVIGPGICAVYPSGGTAGSSVATTSGFVGGVCPVSVDATGGAANGVADASVGGTAPVGGIC